MTNNDDKPLSPAQAGQIVPEGREDLVPGHDTGSVVVRPKQTKKSGHNYPLKLTPQQRRTLLEYTHLGGKLKKKIEHAGEGTQVVPVTSNELNKLDDETGKAAVYARSPHKTRLLAVMRRVVKLREREHAREFDVAAPPPVKRRPGKTKLLFQFKITLIGVEPSIWRRIQVRDCSLDTLHEHIQAAMGWTNSHLHQFEIMGERYGDPELLEDDIDNFEYADSFSTHLSDFLPATGQRFDFQYEYDFGDSWMHEVLFEGNPQIDPKVKYPVCVEGKRACPPEDCGGVRGYGEFLEAIRDPQHEEHESMLEWIGGRFDPEYFDAKKKTKAMKKGLPDWRNMR